MPIDKQIVKVAKIAACRELYLRGYSHKTIEDEMHNLGFRDFSRRILYKRTTGRGRRPGWIAEFEWNAQAGNAVRDWSAGILACKAGSSGLTEVNAEQRSSELGDNRVHHAGGTGVGKQDACAPFRPGNAASTGAASIPACEAGSSGLTRIAAEQFSGELSNNYVITPEEPASASREACAPVTGARDPGFIEWLKRVSPNMTWTWRHQQYIYKQLQRVTDGLCKRLMIFMPPRHGKSELVTVRYTAWRMRRKPSMNVILASYGQKLANRFSRSIRRVLCDDALLSEPGAVATGSNDGRFPETGNSATTGSSDRQSVAAGAGNPVATAPGSDAMFPFISQKPVNSVAEWGTAAGGGLRAVGVGSGVTGFGADLIVIDDPVKNRAQAESETYRERVWDWYTDDLYTRLEPNGAIVLIQTRWHEDDLAGRLLKQMDDGGDQWEIVDLPAIATGFPTGAASILACEAGSSGLTEVGIDQQTGELSDNNDRRAGGTGVGKQDACAPVSESSPPYKGGVAAASADGVVLSLRDEQRAVSLETERVAVAVEIVEPNAENHPTAKAAPLLRKEGISGGDWRSPGDALCPERFPKAKLAEIKSQLGTYSFSALYQQQPTPADGAIFKKKWLKNIVDAAPSGLRWFRGYDLAISTRTTADYTASFRVAVDDLGFLYIADGFRKRIEYPEQRRYIIERIKTERDTQHGIEDSANAKAIISELRRDLRLSNFSFKTVPVVGDKLTRALNWSPRAEEGKLRLVRGPWIDDFIAELIRFPKGKHDDQIDAVSIAVHMMAGGVDKKLYRF